MKPKIVLVEVVPKRQSLRVSHEKVYETMVTSGQAALTSFLTMNGGASVAFLTFISTQLEKHSFNANAGGYIIWAMQLYISGTFMAVCGFGAIFLTNCLSYIDCQWARKCMFGVTIICGFASLALFVWASAEAIQGFSAANLFATQPPSPPVP